MKPWKIILIAVSALVLVIPLTAYATVSMFADVPDNHIFVEDINWMKTAGVTNGCGDGTNYCPNDNVTRGQMAAFMHRLAVNKVVDAGTLDGKDSNDYIYNAEWVEGTYVSTSPGVLPGNTVNNIATCPRLKYVISGGGQSSHPMLLTMNKSRPFADKTGWSVNWTNTSDTEVSPTLTVWALCAGPGLIALP